jgi:Helix-turn-helix domain
MSTVCPPVRRILIRPLPKPNPSPALAQVSLAPAKKLVRIVPPVRPQPIPMHARIPVRAVHIGADPDILVVEDVADILRCTVDTARRIPRDHLPAYPGAGRHRLYLREDVLAYVRLSASISPNADILMQRIAGEVLGSRPGDGRERSTRRRSR